MRARALHVVALVWALLLPGRSPAADVTVFAAASLTDALHEIAERYETGSGNHLTMSFGASSDLARQIKAGAPADVFLSADLAQMEGLERDGLVRRADRIDVLSNLLVAIVPAASKAAVQAPGDLLRVRYLALASPEAVPAGVYARKYLESQGLWEKLQPKVVPTADVRAVLAAVASEHADAGMVYRTDAAISTRVRVAFEVAREQGPPIVYPFAPVAASKQKDLAAAVVKYLTGPESLTVFERFGFVVLGR